MPRSVKLHKILFDDLPSLIVRHLEQRIRERKISPQDLAKWRYWISTSPHAPEGDWYKDFGSFKLVGQGPYPKSVLLPGMSYWGTKLAYLITVEELLGE
jgi:hypothetical protein